MAIKLSDRLQLMADMIEPGQSMADIGTDHGYLPIYLWERGISPKVIMCDISRPSLQKAIDLAAAHDDRSGLSFRAGNGLEVLEAGEVDRVVIAGMGGQLITDILSADIKKTITFPGFIMQPRNHSDHLRYWLTCKGFSILSNRLVREGHFICEVIEARSPSDADRLADNIPGPADPSWLFPRDMSGEALAKDFLQIKRDIEMKKLAGMSRGSSVSAADKVIVQRKIEYLDKFIKK